jgi:HAD superfamily hydrolase (TIGR01509 family)
MIKAIVFDCFGVLATDGWLPFKNEYFGQDPKLLERATELNKMVDSGLASHVNFVDEIAKMANVKVEYAYKLINDNVPDEELFKYIKDLKKKYKIGLLSNAGENWLEAIFTPEQLRLFDATVLSYEISVVKPHPLAYETVAKKLDVEIDECVFVDDQERYCTGAKEVGMQAVIYTDSDNLKTKLNKLLDN